MQTVKLAPDPAIKCCCDTESTRYALGGVAVFPRSKDQVFLAATNSHVLAVTSCEGQYHGYTQDLPVVMPLDILPKNAKERNTLATKTSMSPNDPESWIRFDDEVDSKQWHSPFNRTADRVDGRFPRARDVMPMADANDYLIFTLDAQLLLNLSKALTDGESRGITVFVPKEDSGKVTKCVPVMGNLGVGALMPLSIEDEKPQDAVNRYNAWRDEFARCSESETPTLAEAELGETGAAVAEDIISGLSADPDPFSDDDPEQDIQAGLAALLSL